MIERLSRTEKLFLYEVPQLEQEVDRLKKWLGSKPVKDYPEARSFLRHAESVLHIKTLGKRRVSRTRKLLKKVIIVLGQ